MFSFKIRVLHAYFTGVYNERNQFFGFVFMMVSRTVSLECLYNLSPVFISRRFIIVGDGVFEHNLYFLETKPL